MRRLLFMALFALFATLALAAPALAATIDVNPGADIDVKVNGAHAGDLIRVHCGTGGAAVTYTASQVMTLPLNAQLVGDTGTQTTYVNATNPAPCATIKGSSTFTGTTLFKYSGDSPTRIAWVILDATNTQKAVNGSTGSQGNSIDHVDCINSPASCIGQYAGYLGDSELFNDGTDATNFDGTVAGVKCVQACEIARVYAHANPGNGAWCDVGCIADTVNRPNGFYVHDGVFANGQRHGIFYENSPRPCSWIDPVTGTRKFQTPCNFDPTGQTTYPQPTALIDNNDVFGNTKSEISVADSQNGTVSNNTLGKNLKTATVVPSASGWGVEIHSANDLTRGDEANAHITNNTFFGGEIIKPTGSYDDGTPQQGCGFNGNTCSGNIFN